MERIDIRRAQKLGSPNPFALLTTKKPDGGDNVMAVSWWSYASNNPPLLTACLSNKGYSGELIREAGVFSLSLPGEGIKEAAFSAGTRSGRGVSKAEAIGLPLEQTEEGFPAAAAGSRVVFNCRLVNAYPAGDHTIYLGEVVSVYANPEVPALYALEGYSKLGTV